MTGFIVGMIRGAGTALVLKLMDAPENQNSDMFGATFKLLATRQT